MRNPRNNEAKVETYHPFVELEIPEDDLSYLDYVDRAQEVFRLLQENQLYKDGLIYCGFNGEVVRNNGTFGERRKTWGVTQEGFLSSCAAMDKTDDGSKNPLYQASLSSAELPALVVLDGDKLQEDPKNPQGEQLEWVLTDGVTMDEAAVAVIYLTH